MKVLQINSIYEKFSTGRSVKEMHEFFLKNNVESYVAASENINTGDHFYKIGNNFDEKTHALLSRITGLQGYYSCISTRFLIQYIEKIKPDIVLLHNLHANYINLHMILTYLSSNNIATVLQLHDCWFFTGKCCCYIDVKCDKWKTNCNKCPAKHKYNNSFFFDFSNKMYKDKIALFSKFNNLAVVGVSKWVTDDAKESLLKNAKYIKTIYNWIDLDLFKPHNTTQLRKDLGLQNKFVIFGIATGWSVAKGIKVFYELSKVLDDSYQIVLAGNLSNYKYKTDKIKFLGTITDVKEIADLYAMADVFVNPSIMETFGKTTAEALCSGTPVIAYNSTATPELVGTDNKCGFLLEKNDINLYKEKIDIVKESGKDKYVNNTRKRAEKMFSYTNNLNEFLELFNNMLKK